MHCLSLLMATRTSLFRSKVRYPLQFLDGVGQTLLITMAFCVDPVHTASAGEVAVASFLSAHTFEAGDLANFVAVGDFNGDGKADLAVADLGGLKRYPKGGVSILLGNGDGT